MHRPSVRVLPLLAVSFTVLLGPPVLTPALVFGVGVFVDAWAARHALRVGVAQLAFVALLLVTDGLLDHAGLRGRPQGLGLALVVVAIAFVGGYLPSLLLGIALDLPRAPARPVASLGDLLRLREAPSAPRRAPPSLPAEPTRVDQACLAAPRLAVVRQEDPTFVSRFAPRPEDLTEWVRGPGALVAPDSAGR